MISRIFNKKHLVTHILSNLIPNYRIINCHLKQCSSVFLFIHSNFNTIRDYNAKCNYANTNKVFEITNDGKNSSSILSMDAFQLFGLETKYHIDSKNLDSNYKELMRKLHPDICNDTSRDISIHIINQYNIMKDPFERGLLLASVKSKIPRDTLINLMDEILVDSNVLEQVFEVDENINNIGTNNFRMKDFDEIEKKKELKIGGCINSLEEEFEKDDMPITKVLSILKELRIYQKLSDRMSSVLDNSTH